MRFKLGFTSGFAAGYYFGARAGRQRYESINRGLQKIRRSDQFEAVTEKAKSVIDDNVDTVVAKVRQIVPNRSNGSSTTDDASPAGTNTIPAAAPLTGNPPTAQPEPQPVPGQPGTYSSSR